MDSLLGRGKCQSLPPYEDALNLADAYSEFFITKIQKIRDILSELSQSTKEMTCPPIKSLLKPYAVTLETFTPTTKEEIISILKKSPKASCILGPIPSNLLCPLLSNIAPVIKEIVNNALSSGCFPSCMKSATVKPLLKKSTQNPEIFKNYRPVSNLSYVSKVNEKVIAARLLLHMQDQNLLDPFQSAYRSAWAQHRNCIAPCPQWHPANYRHCRWCFSCSPRSLCCLWYRSLYHLALISGESHWTEGHSFANVPLLSLRTLTTHLCE